MHVRCSGVTSALTCAFDLIRNYMTRSEYFSYRYLLQFIMMLFCTPPIRYKYSLGTYSAIVPISISIGLIRCGSVESNPKRALSSPTANKFLTIRPVLSLAACRTHMLLMAKRAV